MLQIVHFDENLKNEVFHIENNCEKLCKMVEQQFEQRFFQIGMEVSVELLRTFKGKQADKGQIFFPGYESFIEIGLIKENEYFPNAYIPIWKCKNEMFYQIGYLTRFDIKNIEMKLNHILNEVYLERTQE